MAQRVQIECVNKSDRYNPHEKINYIGGRNADGTRWKISQQQAIRYIEDGTYSFYVSRNGVTANVIVATHLGNKYIKTVSDGTLVDNLLSLQECPL